MITKIQSGAVSSNSTVFEPQARFLATCIRRLERDVVRELGANYDPSAGIASRFWDIPAYEIFHDAAYACGFVCDDLTADFPIDVAQARPQLTLGGASFPELRHYLHTLMRAERSNRMDGYFSPVLEAVHSGALGVVAGRLEGDESLYSN
jgi:hypothetical protein